jgi:DNA-binding NarL/FixJ family response regulator
MWSNPMTTIPTKICIVEDNFVIKEGYKILIDSISKYHVVNTYTSCEEALDNIESDAPDVVLMDLELPGMSGIEGIGRIKKKLPKANIIVVSLHTDKESVFQSFNAGAAGFMAKAVSYSDLLDGIDEVLQGGAPLSKEISRMVIESFQRNTDSPLSRRETEVLEKLAEGKSYSQIADELFVHRETIKTHIKNIYIKLGVKSKANAIEIGRHNKYI